MTKKNLKPQQSAPVQREINTTACEGGMGLTPTLAAAYGGSLLGSRDPFAGDDAE
jgi:prenylated cyclic peptide (anacyclamide/piricyclamide family)